MFRRCIPLAWGAVPLLALALFAPPARAWCCDYPSLGWYLFKGPIYPLTWQSSQLYGLTSLDSLAPSAGGLNFPHYAPGYNTNFPGFGGEGYYGYGFNAYLTQRYLRFGPYFDNYGQFRPHPWSNPRPLVPIDPAAHFLVKVPDDAEVWLEGVKMQQTGPARRFVSPPLEFGEKYVYTVRARWTADGRPVEQSKELVVGPGDWVSITFPTPTPAVE